MEIKVAFHLISDEENFSLEDDAVKGTRKQIKILADPYPLMKEHVKREVSNEAQKALKELIAEKYQSSEIIICKKTGARYGQPCAMLEDNREKTLINVSVSHNKDAFAVCISKSRLVGIDLQSEIRATVSSLWAFFSSEERNVLNNSKAGAGFSLRKTATIIWTIKEAFLKAIGVGFRYGFNSLIVADIDWEQGEMVLHISNRISNFFNRGSKINLYISPGTSQVLTVAVINNIAVS